MHLRKIFFFTPGGRVRKNESHVAAIQRIAHMEMNASSCPVQSIQMMGVWDHFYEKSAFSEEVSTHYVNIPYLWPWSGDLGVFLKNLPKDQHSEWLWMSPQEILASHEVHEYVKLYAEWVLNFLKDDGEKK